MLPVRQCTHRLDAQRALSQSACTPLVIHGRSHCSTAPSCSNRTCAFKSGFRQRSASCVPSIHRTNKICGAANVRCQAASADIPPSEPVQQIQEPAEGDKPRSWLFGVGLIVAAAGIALLANQQGVLYDLKDTLAKSSLGKSGFPAAFSLIFLSEIGDKTFFIAALLASKFGKWLSFSASLLSLSVMTIISVVIGRSFRHVPDFLKTGLPIGEWAAAALLVFFGIKTIREAWALPTDAEGEEFVDARDSIDTAEREGRIGGKTVFQAFAQVATLIFLAEWGDRSMLATIVLAISQSPAGVAGGAIAGHAVATLLAVVGGAIASKFVSEKTIGYIGGTLFIAFAGLGLLGLY